MTKTKDFEEFMAVVDWEGLTTGEKRALYEAARGQINVDGIPFKVLPSNTSEKVTLIEYTPDDICLVLTEDALAYFPTWLEKTYMEGEVGDVYLSLLEANEKDD